MTSLCADLAQDPIWIIYVIVAIGCHLRFFQFLPAETILSDLLSGGGKACEFGVDEKPSTVELKR